MSAVQPLSEEPARKEGTVQAPARLRMTYEEYLHWADEDVHAEWMGGEVIVQMPPKAPHQRLVEFLDRLPGLSVEISTLGLVRLAPFELRLWPEGPARQPDLMFLAATHHDRLTHERVAGPPDLIIEVVSDESVQQDQVEKFAEYEAAGVPEYWVLGNQPGHQQALFYRLGAEGRYERVLPDAQGIYRSVVVEGFWLRVAWLWEPEPNALRVLAEVLGPERLLDALCHCGPWDRPIATRARVSPACPDETSASGGAEVAQLSWDWSARSRRAPAYTSRPHARWRVSAAQNDHPRRSNSCASSRKRCTSSTRLEIARRRLAECWDRFGASAYTVIGGFPLHSRAATSTGQQRGTLT